MALTFQNLYSEEIYLAVVAFGGGCPGGDYFHKTGWFAIPPGGSFQALDRDLRIVGDPNYYWFASVGFGGPCWSGNWNFNITQNAFDQCSQDDANGCVVPTPFIPALFNPKWSDLTILLLAPGAAGQQYQGCAWAIPTISDQPPVQPSSPPFLGQGVTPPWDENPQ